MDNITMEKTEKEVPSQQPQQQGVFDNVNTNFKLLSSSSNIPLSPNNNHLNNKNLNNNNLNNNKLLTQMNTTNSLKSNINSTNMNNTTKLLNTCSRSSFVFDFSFRCTQSSWARVRQHVIFNMVRFLNLRPLENFRPPEW